MLHNKPILSELLRSVTFGMYIWPATADAEQEAADTLCYFLLQVHSHVQICNKYAHLIMR